MNAFARLFWPKHLAGKLAVCAVGLAVLTTALFAAACYSADARLEAAWRLSDADGLPRTMEELFGPALASHRNCATPLDASADLAVGFERTVSASLREAAEKLETAIEDDPRYAAEIVKAARADADYEKRLQQADALSEFRSTVVVTHPMINMMLTAVQNRRSLVRVEMHLARAEAKNGDRDAAVRRMLRQLRLTEKWAVGEPFLISELVAIAIRTVAMGEINAFLREGSISPEVHDEIERTVARLENISREFKRALQAEKISMIDSYASFVPGGGVGLLRPRNADDQAWMIDLLYRCQQQYDKPRWQAAPALAEIEKSIQEQMRSVWTRFRRMGSTLMLPAVFPVRTAYDRTIAKARALRVVNAMARKKDWQTPLEALGLSAEATVDPFTGKPLLVKQTADGPIVYSVGEDGKDDGGAEVGSLPGMKSWDYGLGPKVNKPAAAK